MQESAPDREQIARLAYFYWEQRGCIHGCHEEDWYRAESDLRRSRNAVSQTSDQPRADTALSRTVIGVFHSLKDAQRAFDDLTAEGFSHDEISLIANKAGTTEWTEAAAQGPSEPESIDQGRGIRIADDAGIGAAVGGIGGLLLSVAGLAIPGIGPVLAAGPIVAALGGAGLGAAAGGVIGALVESGVPEEKAGHYAESVRRGGTLITVRASGDRADRAAELLDRAGAVDIDDRVSDWRNRGWTWHDSNAQPLTEDELRREREYFRAAGPQGDEWQKMSAAEAKNAGNDASRSRKRGGQGNRETPVKGMAAVETAVPQLPRSEERRPASRIYG
jgi:hypothetical protein